MKVTVDAVVSAYVSTRDEIARLQSELDDKLKPLQKLQEVRETYLMTQLNDIGAKNINTPHGTVYQVRKESIKVSEWESFLRWAIINPILGGIRELNAGIDVGKVSDMMKSVIKSEFFNRAVNKTSVLEMMGNERKDPPPPGVDYTAIRAIQIRR